jgi:hypothetical protein
MVDSATHEDAQLWAVVQARHTAAVANERAQEVAAVQGKASYVELLGHNVYLAGDWRGEMSRSR